MIERWLRMALMSALILAAGPVHAQLASCALPERVPTPRVDRQQNSAARRIVPIEAHVLALSWSPQHCLRAGPSDTFQCAGRQYCGHSPSVDLLQHEWAKHGTCMTRSPERYFAQGRDVYGRVRFPEMEKLAAAEGLTVGRFTAAFVAVNGRRLPARSVKVRVTRDGWLQEVQLCLDRQLRFAACGTDDRQVRTTQRMRIRLPS